MACEGREEFKVKGVQGGPGVEFSQHRNVGKAALAYPKGYIVVGGRLIANIKCMHQDCMPDIGYPTVEATRENDTSCRGPLLIRL